MLNHLSLQNFRSYPERRFVFSEGVNVIVGKNGVGKTNIIEAIHVLLKGTSFRVSLKDTVQYDKDWMRIDAQTLEHDFSFRFNTIQKPLKRLLIDDVITTRAKAELPKVVLFEPEFLHILSGSPVRRRDYLNFIAGEWFEDAKPALKRYERVLLQRNNLLKQSEGFLTKDSKDQLFVWDIMLAELASKIEHWRHDIIAIFNASLSDIYSEIASSNNQLEVIYSLKKPSSEQDILHQLQAHEALDARRGYTSTGPHRHDFSVLLNKSLIDTSASRGEIRSISIALKKLEIRQHEQEYQDTIILFDDIFSELDETRQAALMKDHEKYQLFITTPSVPSTLSDQARMTINL